MNDYIKNNKEAWEEAFENRSSTWGKDIISRIKEEEYPFFNKETINILKKYNLKDKTIGQFCCNNGRELMSLVKTTHSKGIGFDIAQNQIEFANNCKKELNLDCKFIQTNIYDINNYNETFDLVIITVGALFWFHDLDKFFNIISKTMKKDGIIIINESHPLTNMLAMEGDDDYDNSHPLSCVYSYFNHEWKNNQGMTYITGKEYNSKTFTDYTHSLSEIISSMCKNKILITNFEEYDHDIGVGLTELNGKQFPLSMIIEGKKE